MFIDQQAASLFSDRSHRQVQLITAVTTQRSQDLASEALRVDAHQRSIVLLQVAENNRQRSFGMMTAIRGFPLEANRLKHSPPGRDLRRGYFSKFPALYHSSHDSFKCLRVPAKGGQ